MDPNKRPDDMERITTPELAQAFIDEQVAAIREQVGDGKVLLALSGGVDECLGELGGVDACHGIGADVRVHAGLLAVG